MKSAFVYLSYILAAVILSFAPPSFATDCGDTSPDPEGVGQNKLCPAGKDCINDPALAKGKGLQQPCTAIKGNIADFLTKKVPEWNGKGLQTPQFEELKKSYGEYIKNREGCLSGHASAGSLCMEGTSPDLAGGAADVNSLLSGLGQNANDSCGKASNAMDMAKAALTAFTAACGSSKGMCNNSCGKASKGAEDLVKLATAAKSSATCTGTDPSCQINLLSYQNALQQALTEGQKEANAGTKESVAGKGKMCQNDFGKQIGSALQGIMSMLQGMKQANNCEEETDGTAEATPTAEKCTLEANAALPECICMKNPRTAGCTNSAGRDEAGGNSQVGTGQTDGANLAGSSDTANLNLGSTGIEQAERPSDSGSSGGAGAPTGGGAGIGSSTVGNGSGPNTGNGADGRKGLNANILGGTSGGGGGGGAGGGGSGDKYRAYLPGGAKDPVRAVAGQQAWKNEVTGEGGKSNWEKVKERYKDNRGSLLNN